MSPLNCCIQFRNRPTNTLSTYRIDEQRRLRRVKVYAQTRQSLRRLHTQSNECDVGWRLGSKLDLYPQWARQPLGDILIISYIRRLGSFWGVQNFEFQYLGGGRKKNWGIKILWKFLRGHDTIELYLGVISMHFWGLFLRSRYRMGIFSGFVKLQILFWGA